MSKCPQGQVIPMLEDVIKAEYGKLRSKRGEDYKHGVRELNRIINFSRNFEEIGVNYEKNLGQVQRWMLEKRSNIQNSRRCSNLPQTRTNSP
jgi:hypothetical protein